MQIAVTGGAPLVICEISDLGGMAGLFGASWDRHDDIFLGRGSRGIQRVSANGGEPETVMTVNAGEVAHGPQLLPDGEHLLFTLATDEPGSERWDRAQIVVQSLKSRARKTLIQNGSDARYIPSSGYIIYAEGTTLRAIAFDATRLETVGEPMSIVDDVRRATEDGATGAAQFGASATGTLAYIPGGVPPTYRSLALIDMKGETKVLAVLPGLNHTPRFSANGQQIAWQGGDGNIWIHDRTGTRATRQLTSNGTSNAPVWTPDDRIVFQASRDGDTGLFWQPADGSAGAELLLRTEPGFSDIPTSVSTDGKTFLFLKRSNPVRGDRSKSSEREDGIWMLPLVGARTPRRLIALEPAESRFGAAVFSTNGRWIAYKAQPGGSVYVEPFPPTGAPRSLITSEQSWAPMWAPDGKRLLFLGGPRRSGFFGVDILRSDASFEYGPPKHLFDVKIPVNTFGDGGRIADVSPDGKNIVAFQDARVPDAAPAPSKIHVVLGWVTGLQPRQARVY
jgi:Tol biopolymer transport system component